MNRIVYDPFWELLRQKGISQYQLIHQYGGSAGTLQRMRENRSMYLSTIDKLCDILDCGIEDVMKDKEDE